MSETTYGSTRKMMSYLAGAGGSAALASAATGQILSNTFDLPVNVNEPDQLLDLESMVIQAYTGTYDLPFQDDEWDIRIRAASYFYVPPIYVSYYGYTYYRPGGYGTNDQSTVADAGGQSQITDEYGVLYPFGDDAASFGLFAEPGQRLDGSFRFDRNNTPVQQAGADNGAFEDLQNLEFIVPVKVEDGYGWVRYRIETYTVITDLNDVPQNLKNITVVDAAFNPDGGIIAGQAVAPAECVAETTGDSLVDAADVDEFISRLGVRTSIVRDEFDQTADLAPPYSRFVSTDAFDLFKYLNLAANCPE